MIWSLIIDQHFVSQFPRFYRAFCCFLCVLLHWCSTPLDAVLTFQKTIVCPGCDASQLGNGNFCLERACEFSLLFILWFLSFFDDFAVVRKISGFQKPILYGFCSSELGSVPCVLFMWTVSVYAYIPSCLNPVSSVSRLFFFCSKFFVWIDRLVFRCRRFFLAT